jgi:Dynamitin
MFGISVEQTLVDYFISIRSIDFLYKFSVFTLKDFLFQVTEAYALLKRWEETINTLPAVVDRLVALKAVHEQGLAFLPAHQSFFVRPSLNCSFFSIASSFVQLQQEVEELQQQLAAKVSIMEGNIKLVRSLILQADQSITFSYGIFFFSQKSHLPKI